MISILDLYDLEIKDLPCPSFYTGKWKTITGIGLYMMPISLLHNDDFDLRHLDLENQWKYYISYLLSIYTTSFRQSWLGNFCVMYTLNHLLTWLWPWPFDPEINWDLSPWSHISVKNMRLKTRKILCYIQLMTVTFGVKVNDWILWMPFIKSISLYLSLSEKLQRYRKLLIDFGVEDIINQGHRNIDSAPNHFFSVWSEYQVSHYWVNH